MSTEGRDESSRNVESPERRKIIGSSEETEETSGSRKVETSGTSVSSRSEGSTVSLEAKYRKSIQVSRPATTETLQARSRVKGEAGEDGGAIRSCSSSRAFASPTKLEKDGGSCVSSTGDICRICHMGGFPAISGSRPIWEWPNRGARRAESQTSTISSYAYLGPLISACKCRGTVGLVHTECLERWLTESGHTRCELCGHRYSTKRVPRHGIFRSVVIWFNTVIATRQMLLDVLYLFVTTPLALFSCYVCALALKMILESGFRDIPWMIVAMLPTCSLTLVAYWGWLITLGRYISRLHSRRWRRFWRNNFVVRLIPRSPEISLDAETRLENSPRDRMEYRTSRRLNFEDNDFLFDRLPDDEEEDFLRIVDNFLQS